MATSAQVLANRANAALSTGPRTEAGKSASCSNAVRHGMTSKQVVLPHEGQEEWESLREGIIASFAPATDLEHTMAVNVAETYWRLRRMQRMETAVMTARMKAVSEADPSLQGDEAMAVLMTDPAEMKRMSLMLRYVTSAERAHYKALDHLRKLQKERRRVEEEAQQQEAFVELCDISTERIGFVSHGNATVAEWPQTDCAIKLDVTSSGVDDRPSML